MTSSRPAPRSVKSIAVSVGAAQLDIATPHSASAARHKTLCLRERIIVLRNLIIVLRALIIVPLLWTAGRYGRRRLVSLSWCLRR
ncbi:hypothetical protein GCM10009038_18990 [Salinicola rhizosphaerae]|uniref:Uncharacterized protein n=1 Tax=Salinicola rhizosphaerae TaxID=1443141 RepID=A0ABQ3E154_9GAMM|nr:hypothetical protein GCM10009038_18990 [Salinicola rhizosphaerae]